MAQCISVTGEARLLPQKPSHVDRLSLLRLVECFDLALTSFVLVAGTNTLCGNGAHLIRLMSLLAMELQVRLLLARAES